MLLWGKKNGKVRLVWIKQIVTVIIISLDNCGNSRGKLRSMEIVGRTIRILGMVHFSKISTTMPLLHCVNLWGWCSAQLLSIVTDCGWCQQRGLRGMDANLEWDGGGWFLELSKRHSVYFPWHQFHKFSTAFPNIGQDRVDLTKGTLIDFLQSIDSVEVNS